MVGMIGDETAAVPAPAVGRRERNKRTKEALIREAARALFLEHGFEATTLRAVADQADVGFGTVFAYAHDKAGLLAMVFVEELKALPPLFPDTAHAGGVLDELVDALGRLYAFWSGIPALSGQVLQQMEFYSTNPHMEVIVGRRAEARRDLAGWLGRLRDAGRIRSDIDVEQASETLFAIYTSAVREWSATTPGDVEGGKVRLRRLMALAVEAMLPR